MASFTRKRANGLGRQSKPFVGVEMNVFGALIVCGCFSAVAGYSALAAETAAKHYGSPEEAVQALMAAVKAGDDTAMIVVLGSEAKPLIDSGDAVADGNTRERFVKLYDTANEIVKDDDAKAVLEIGKDGWPFPIPIVKEEAGWRFDTAAGEEEILDRRIGKNELSTVQVCLAIVDAQREYYVRNPEKTDLLHYAQRFLSEEGKRNGLYWKTAEDDEPSPLGPLVAGARAEGYQHGEAKEGRRPYHGYYYKMLTAQGPSAPGGAYDYVAHGEMIGGFAAVAYPAEYGSSGIMTFLVSHDGVVYQSDLGEETETVVEKMTKFEPDSSWERVAADTDT
jgi:hypothetical protein